MSIFDGRFLLVQALIGTNKKYYDEKMKTCDSNLDKLISLVKNIMHQNHNYSPDQVE